MEDEQIMAILRTIPDKASREKLEEHIVELKRTIAMYDRMHIALCKIIELKEI